jgi:hypothetical protein
MQSPIHPESTTDIALTYYNSAVMPKMLQLTLTLSSKNLTLFLSKFYEKIANFVIFSRNRDCGKSFNGKLLTGKLPTGLFSIAIWYAFSTQLNNS